MNGITTKTTSAVQPRSVSGTTGTSPTVIISARALSGGPAPASATREVESAVYAYLRVMRSLKRTRVTPENVASALGISVASALAALAALQSKGVRRSK
jgi:hypothetical protein